MGNFFSLFLVYLVSTLLTMVGLYLGYKIYAIRNTKDEEEDGEPTFVDAYEQRKYEQEKAKREELEKAERMKKRGGKIDLE